jgi:uncharacterized protein
MALKAAPADQALLLELHALDMRLQQLRNRAAKLPEEARLAELAAERDRVRRTLSAQTGELDDARAELRRVESDVELVDARIARDRDRLAASSSTKDIQGLEHELAALAKRKSDLEDIELAVMETLEQREAAVAATTAEADRIAADTAAATAARDAALGSIAGDRSAAERDRGTIAGRVPSELLDLYERQRSRYGIGASHLQRGVTSASGVALTASDMNTVRLAAPDDVILCPDSNAILVRTDESGL